MDRASIDGESGQPLSEEAYALVDRPLWAPDHSGALVNTTLDQSGHSALLWLPANGGPALEIAQDISTGNVRWGHE